MTREELLELIRIGGGIGKAKLKRDVWKNESTTNLNYIVPSAIGDKHFLAWNDKEETSWHINGNWELYEEPKPKVKVAPYEYIYRQDNRLLRGTTSILFRDDVSFLDYTSNVIKYVRRTDLEVEI